ncbi:ankyrin repeat domain-containing protein [Pseudoalteromonas fenneropenaei]|uniref:Ankyrin repeat domain-containing protein n=1 Tax=Pseudoalteromonas fenneropenaei TaxID=1737459 RepID=A0ABV7CIH0_9GAMM
MEQVLIWPKEYPLLVKGLAEQNGAFILDALEAWPSCKTATDEQGVNATVLPPLYYLQWLKPLEPFEACYFQHIAEFDDASQSYIQRLISHFNQLEMGHEAQVLALLEPFCQYSDLACQAHCDAPLSLFKLLYDKRLFNVLLFCLERGAKLHADDVMLLWQEVALRERLTPFITAQSDTLTGLKEAAIAAMAKGEDYYTLLTLLESGDDLNTLLEQALLALLSQEQAKQTMAMRFIQQGATGSVRNEAEQSAWHLAAQHGFVEVIENLAQACPTHLSSQDKDGNTALHFAVQGNALEMMRKLIQLGDKPQQRNHDNLTPYGLAVQLRRQAMVKCLEQEFALKELSEQAQLSRMSWVHGLYALALLCLPLQLFFFFDESFAAKSEVTLTATLMAVMALIAATRVKRGKLYPQRRHPWSWHILVALSWLAGVCQLGLSALVLLTLLTQ